MSSGRIMGERGLDGDCEFWGVFLSWKCVVELREWNVGMSKGVAWKEHGQNGN